MATPAESAGTHTAFYADPTFWVAVGFLLFLALLWRMGVHRALGAGLDGRAAKVRRDLDEAARLRAEAEALLAQAQTRHAAAAADSAAILDQARRGADALATKAAADLSATVARRAKDAEARITTAERAAIASLRAQVATLATAAAARIVAEDADATLHARLADRAIADLERRLN